MEHQSGWDSRQEKKRKPGDAGSQSGRTLKGRYRRALSLVEMLFVLVIIVLIAVIVMPVLQRAQLNAHRSTCISNLRQSALAVSMYLEDYDNTFPTYRVDAHYVAHVDDLLTWHDHYCRALGTQPNQVSWVSQTRIYTNSRYRTYLPSGVNSGDTYHCPDDTDRGTSATSYEYKMLLATGPPVSEVRVPGTTAMLWEQWAFHTEERLSEYDRRAEMNILFVDGHATWTRLINTTNARFGKGPDLHWMPSGSTIPPQYRDDDVVN